MGQKIRQRVAAGNNFEATAPINPPVVDDGATKTYSEEDSGGEFSPPAGKLRMIILHGGSQSSVEFKVVFYDGGEQQLLAHPFPCQRVMWDGDVELADGDKVLVTTKNAKCAMSCDVVVV